MHAILLLLVTFFLSTLQASGSSGYDTGSFDESNTKAPYNHLILESINTMPEGGGYSIRPLVEHRMRKSVTIQEDHFKFNTSLAKPSFCSEATYLVFLKTLSALQKQGTLDLPSPILEKLYPYHQADGYGIWGRWNANGPGTARLFTELGLGSNFIDLSKAIPGDFLKIFWTNSIGAEERGHSVVFLGTEMKNDTLWVIYWSSNQPGGYGKRMVASKYIHHFLFSRLLDPEAVLNAPSLPKKDAYLASLLRCSSSLQEMKKLCGL